MSAPKPPQDWAEFKERAQGLLYARPDTGDAANFGEAIIHAGLADLARQGNQEASVLLDFYTSHPDPEVRPEAEHK